MIIPHTVSIIMQVKDQWDLSVYCPFTFYSWHDDKYQHDKHVSSWCSIFYKDCLLVFS